MNLPPGTVRIAPCGAVRNEGYAHLKQSTLFSPAPCWDTLARIEAHARELARVQRISRMLAGALAAPALLPCPPRI
ncbi:hypothetical protein [Streptomyces rimosus]|uniref:hypothetical protein n=1 Tax=Streptomyces rimosus TaxID=1927 RepID=UPI0004C1D5F7|nr:hypothetical protein [Streptomyces rimosus]